MTGRQDVSLISTSRAASLIDANLEKLAMAVDDIRHTILKSAEDGQSLPILNNLCGPLTSVSTRLRTTRGDELIAQAKSQVERNPVLVTLASAALGAALAQIAVTTVRNERHLKDMHISQNQT